MPVVDLTDLFIRKVKPDTRTIYWDRTLPAFGVRIGSRSKVFILMRGKARKKTALGNYPYLSLADARKQAGAIIYGASLATAAAADTAATVATFLATHRGKERTINDYDRLLTKHFLPTCALKALQTITATDITAITDSLAATPAEQIHAHTAMGSFFSWALGRRIITMNPMQHLPMPAKLQARERVLTDKELVAIYRAAREMGHPFGFIVLICIHTGMRRTEASSLRWSYITDEAITLPPSITKNNTELVLPNLIGENLALIPTAGDLLFPSAAGTVFSAWSKNKAALDALSEVDGWVLHDLRRTFSTIHAVKRHSILTPDRRPILTPHDRELVSH